MKLSLLDCLDLQKRQFHLVQPNVVPPFSWVKKRWHEKGEMTCPRGHGTDRKWQEWGLNPGGLAEAVLPAFSAASRLVPWNRRGAPRGHSLAQDLAPRRGIC